MRLDSRIDDVRLLLACRLDLPDPGNRGVAALRKTDRRLRGLGPGLAEIVGIGQQRTPVPGADTGEDAWPITAGIDRHRVDLLIEKLEVVRGPGAAIISAPRD